MNVSLGKRWQDFVDELIDSGRYSSTSEVVSEGRRLVEEREAKLRALRDTIDASIAEGGGHSDDEVAVYLEAKEAGVAGRETRMNALRAALIEGEQSGPSTAFDIESFIADKRGRSASRD